MSGRGTRFAPACGVTHRESARFRRGAARSRRLPHRLERCARARLERSPGAVRPPRAGGADSERDRQGRPGADAAISSGRQSCIFSGARSRSARLGFTCAAFAARYGRFPGAARVVRAMRRARLPVVIASSANRSTLQQSASAPAPVRRDHRVSRPRTTSARPSRSTTCSPSRSRASVSAAESRSPSAIRRTTSARPTRSACRAWRSGRAGSRGKCSDRRTAASPTSPLSGAKGEASSDEVRRRFSDFTGWSCSRIASSRTRACGARHSPFRFVRRSARAITLGSGPEFFLELRRARRGEPVGRQEVHVAVRGLSGAGGRRDALGGVSTRRTVGAATLVLREFVGPSARAFRPAVRRPPR